jgi:hypothetical protein
LAPWRLLPARTLFALLSYRRLPCFHAERSKDRRGHAGL